jgi:hypothetical protein
VTAKSEKENEYLNIFENATGNRKNKKFDHIST